MSFYALHAKRSWPLAPTVGFIEHGGGERGLALIWLQLEIGVKWSPM